MNRLGYILLCYLLLLAVFPCCTIDQCPEEKIAMEQAAGHETNDGDCGTCSPFFSCEGCTSIPVTVEHAFIQIQAIPVQQVYTGFVCRAIPDASYDFWQPPRIG